MHAQGFFRTDIPLRKKTKFCTFLLTKGYTYLKNIVKNIQPQFWKFIKKIIEKGPNTPKNCVLGTFFAEIVIAKNIFEAQITMVKNNILS